MSYVKLGVVVLIVCIVFGCFYSLYNWGYTTCETDKQAEIIDTQKNHAENETQIKERILSTSDDDNFNWLCKNYKRAD